MRLTEEFWLIFRYNKVSFNHFSHKKMILWSAVLTVLADIFTGSLDVDVKIVT